MPPSISQICSLQKNIEFRIVPWNEFYVVGSDGSVWSCRTRGGRVLDHWNEMARTLVPPDERPTIGLRGEHSKLKVWFVHRLVLTIFVGDCPKGLEGCHSDGNPQNCNLSNLRWDTRKANIGDSVRHGRSQRGVKNRGCKLTPEIVKAIRQRYAEGGETQKGLAKEYGVWQSCIEKIVNRKSWVWL